VFVRVLFCLFDLLHDCVHCVINLSYFLFVSLADNDDGMYSGVGSIRNCVVFWVFFQRIL
jgi:hypothetical protein